MIQVTTPASGVILIQGSNQSTKVLAPVNTKEARVASSADTLWEADGDGYIRPKGQAMVKGENVEIDISGKVDKVEGMGLSTNNYNNVDANKVSKIIVDGNGTKALRDDGTYGAVGGNARALFFQVDGELEPSTNLCPLIIPFGLTITEIKVKLSEAPIGASVILDLHKNGTSIYTTQANRPTIISGETTALITLPGEVNLIEDDELVLDIDQVGSTAPGTGLTMTLMCGDMFNYSEFTEAQLLALKGEPGQAGEDGVSVPAGGTTDQVLAKASAADHDFKWIYMNGVKNRIYVPKGTPTVYDDEFDDGVISEDWIDVYVPGYQDEFYEPEGLKGLSVLSPYGKGAYKLTGKLKSIGSLTYPCYIETAIKQVAKPFNYPGLCLVFSDGTTMGSGVQVGLSVVMTNYYLTMFRFTGFNTRTNFSDMSRHSGSNYDWLHLRVVWESENTFSTYISADGVTWAKVHSGLNYACTPTYAGVMEVNFEGSSGDVVGTFGYFRARSGLPSNG